MQRSVTVLGGNGLIGRTIVSRLREKGYKTLSIDKADNSFQSASSDYMQGDIFDADLLKSYLIAHKPDIIINCVNVATICSHEIGQGYGKLINFYINLYRILRYIHKPCHYIQVGTTGSGGLGLNIPFTHGEKIEELPIINKAAFAGITTSLLVLLSRSFAPESVQVSELKPGLAIFDPTIKKQPHGMSTLITIDGGESGHYTYQELSLLTAFMGFTSVDKVADALISIINKDTSYRPVSERDVTDVLNQAIVRADSDDARMLESVSSEMKQLTPSNGIIVTGNLGPPQVTRDLILAEVILRHKLSSASQVREVFYADGSVRNTLRYLSAAHPTLVTFIESTVSSVVAEHVIAHCNENQEAWQVVRDILVSRDPLV